MRRGLSLREMPRAVLGMWILVAIGVAAAALGQTPSATNSPTITFTLDFPASDPSHYSISVDGSGHSHYESAVKEQSDGDQGLYRYEFEISPASRERIFALARQAKHFTGKVDSGDGKLAFTGDKTLSYQEGAQSITARYNYSREEPVRQLTALFQNLAATLEHGRKLAYFYRYQKLALDDELKKMEVEVRDGQAAETSAIAPVLQRIADDPTVINVVRARATQLIKSR